MIDWAQIITAVCTGLAVAVPAMLTAYMGWRKFVGEQRNAAILLAKDTAALAEAQSMERQEVAARLADEVRRTADAQSRERQEIAARGKQASLQRSQEAIVRDERLVALTEDIRMNVNGNLEKVVAKVDQLHEKIEGQATKIGEQAAQLGEQAAKIDKQAMAACPAPELRAVMHCDDTDVVVMEIGKRTNPAKKYDPAALDAKRAELAAKGKTIGDVVDAAHAEKAKKKPK